eukprot:TRINITY_DN71806_c0_g2_i2.p1 TRINITY_DN71806_c0_g2~~TRINITY_DN71806_c0_g2_i2.p1  ORF type:complete len:140 (+),score=2.28 TRINITY_DN71806_c0_g2_i2:28-420(+)
MSALPRRKRILKYAKGYYGRAKNCYAIAKNRVEKAMQYSTRDRRAKKRQMREMWITQINAGVRQYGLKYSEFVHSLCRANIKLDRRVMAELAITEPYSFRMLTKQAEQEITLWKQERAAKKQNQEITLEA